MNIDHTKKSIGARMGKGVGSFDKSVCNLKKGTVIFEIFFSTIVSKHELLEALILSSKKLSIPVEIFQKSIKGI